MSLPKIHYSTYTQEIKHPKPWQLDEYGEPNVNEFIISDPCYYIKDSDWGDFCDVWNAATEGQGYGSNIVKWKGFDLVIQSTGGDGSWSYSGLGRKDWHRGGTTHCADTASICCIPFALCDTNPLENYVGTGIIGHTDYGMKDYPEITCEGGYGGVGEPFAIDGIVQDGYTECCGQYVDDDQFEWCDSGSCEGCWSCFECDCEDDKQ